MKHTYLITVFLIFSSFLILNCTRQDDKIGNDKKSPDNGWEILFNGKDLSGWKIFGSPDAKFFVKNGAIVGETQEGIPNSFLGTKKNYEDFILEVDFKVDSSLNSGVQIRSGVHKDETTTSYLAGNLKVSNRTWRKGVVHGYQIEIDPTKRAWTGGFYEEGGRGWLQPLNDPAGKEAGMAYKRDGWNTFKIIANDNHFQTWVNGVKATDYYDGQQRSGFIALQLHSVGRNIEKVGKQVMFKNIRIKELP